MTSSPGLRGWSRLQVVVALQTTTDASEQNNTGPYTMYRQASNKFVIAKSILSLDAIVYLRNKLQMKAQKWRENRIHYAVLSAPWYVFIFMLCLLVLYWLCMTTDLIAISSLRFRRKTYFPVASRTSPKSRHMKSTLSDSRTTCNPSCTTSRWIALTCTHTGP